MMIMGINPQLVSLFSVQMPISIFQQSGNSAFCDEIWFKFSQQSNSGIGGECPLAAGPSVQTVFTHIPSNMASWDFSCQPFDKVLVGVSNMDAHNVLDTEFISPSIDMLVHTNTAFAIQNAGKVATFSFGQMGNNLPLEGLMCQQGQIQISQMSLYGRLTSAQFCSDLPTAYTGGTSFKKDLGFFFGPSFTAHTNDGTKYEA